MGKKRNRRVRRQPSVFDVSCPRCGAGRGESCQPENDNEASGLRSSKSVPRSDSKMALRSCAHRFIHGSVHRERRLRLAQVLLGHVEVAS
jgi:hypothetical protein